MGGRAAEALQTPRSLGPGAWAGCRDAGPLRCPGVVAPAWEGFARPAASPLRESAERPGGRSPHCSISGDGGGGAEAPGLVAPGGVQPSSQAVDDLFGPGGPPSNDLSRPRLLWDIPKYDPLPPPARLFVLATSRVAVFSPPFLTAVVCTHCALFFTTHSHSKPDSVTNVPSTTETAFSEVAQGHVSDSSFY